MRIPLHAAVDVLATHASGLIAFNKPAAVMSHPNLPGACRNALCTVPYDHDEECYEWLDADGNTQRLWLLNRLDSPTSGIVLGSVNPKTAEKVRTIFRERRAQKRYLAVVRGFDFEPKTGTWRDTLAKQHDSRGFVRSHQDGRGKSAITGFRWLKSDRHRLDLALIELTPETGLTHQLRVQCAKHRHPILGDKTYGDFKFNRELKQRTGFNRLALHAAYLEIPLPDGKFRVSAPIPQDFLTFF